MPSLECPHCEAEIDIFLHIGKAEPDVGIMSGYIDWCEYDNDCPDCGADLEDWLEAQCEKHSEDWNIDLE